MNQAKKIFDKVTNLLNQEKYQEAHELVIDNFVMLLDDNPLLLVDMHLDALIKGEMLDLANAGISAYRSLAKDNKKLYDLVKAKEKSLAETMEKSVKKALMDDGEFKKKLNSKDMMQVMVAIRQINENEGLGLYLDDLNAILMDENFPGPQKSLVLASLQSCNFDQKVTMIRYGEYFEFIPKDLPSLEPPAEVQYEVDKIIKIKNMTVIQFTKQIIKMYELGIYPKTSFNDEHQKYLVLVCSYLVACRLFKEPTELKDKLMETYNLTDEEINEMCKDIEFKTSHDIM